MTSMDKDFVLAALLQFNFLPAQKEHREELPPIINSEKLTPSVAAKLKMITPRKGGYDQVEYRTTRHTNVSRALSIPHPLPYVNLCDALAENWQHLQYVTQTKNSLIIPKAHDDGRIVIMDYENATEKIERHVKMSFNRKFYVNTDITNFFPSIYAHAIPWALVGFEAAKGDREASKWFNQIDARQRATKRDETNGVPIGPASSNIICEAILARIDKNLSDEGFEFVRFIDDYTAYFDTYERAEAFIRRLSEELAQYKLLLNIGKTSIGALPAPSTAEWIVDLTARIPQNDRRNAINIVRFLDYAVRRQASNPDGSILKYAVKSVMHMIPDGDAGLVVQYVIGLCVKYPILLPLLDALLGKMSFENGFPYRNQLLQILFEHAEHRRSDAMAWTLYYLNTYAQPVTVESAAKVFGTKDCIAILFLYLSGQYDNGVIEFCNQLDKSDLFLLDQYWLLLYQLFYDGKIVNPYGVENQAFVNSLRGSKDTPENAKQREIQVFDVLKREGVSFVEVTSP